MVVDAWSPAVSNRAVEVEFATAPQFVVGVNGKIAESDEEETLLLKVVQSPDARKPFVEPFACVMDKVFAEKLRGPETIAAVRAPVPFPVRRPPKVVEPVPPKLVASVVEPMTEPLPFVVKMEDVIFVMAKFEEVAAPPLARLPRVRQELPIAKQPEESVTPWFKVEVAVPVWLKLRTERPPWKVEVAVVEVALYAGAVTVPVNTPAPVTASGVPGEVVPTPTFPWLVTVKKVEVAKLLVVEAMTKRFKAAEVEAAKTERRAEGVVVPNPK